MSSADFAPELTTNVLHRCRNVRAYYCYLKRLSFRGNDIGNDDDTRFTATLSLKLANPGYMVLINGRTTKSSAYRVVLLETGSFDVATRLFYRFGNWLSAMCSTLDELVIIRRARDIEKAVRRKRTNKIEALTEVAPGAPPVYVPDEECDQLLLAFEKEWREKGWIQQDLWLVGDSKWSMSINWKTHIPVSELKFIDWKKSVRPVRRVEIDLTCHEDLEIDEKEIAKESSLMQEIGQELRQMVELTLQSEHSVPIKTETPHNVQSTNTETPKSPPQSPNTVLAMMQEQATPGYPNWTQWSEESLIAPETQRTLSSDNCWMQDTSTMVDDGWVLPFPDWQPTEVDMDSFFIPELLDTTDDTWSPFPLQLD